MARAFIGLGSNIGDRQAALDEALRQLKAIDGIKSVCCSNYYETAPVGGIQQGDFLNAVVAVETTLSPQVLLAHCQAIELRGGRQRVERWGPRTLDLDLLDYGQQVIQSDPLTLPHPEAAHRAFVLIPWAELDPEYLLAGKAIKQWLAEVGDAGVYRYERRA